MNKVNEINVGLLTDYDISVLLQKLKIEKEKREKQPEEYVNVIYANDGSEGFYVKVEDFAKVDSEELHIYIAQTLHQGSDIGFSIEKFEKKEYEEHCKQYEWNFGNDEIQSDSENEAE